MKLYFDGASKCNPGHSGCGYIIKNNDDEILYQGYKYIGIATNNEAEYNALLLGIKNLPKTDDKDLIVYGDSKLVIEQMNKKWKINKKELKELNNEINKLCNELNINTTFQWIKREDNYEADNLANLSLKNIN